MSSRFLIRRWCAQILKGKAAGFVTNRLQPQDYDGKISNHALNAVLARFDTATRRGRSTLASSPVDRLKLDCDSNCEPGQEVDEFAQEDYESLLFLRQVYEAWQLSFEFKHAILNLISDPGISGVSIRYKVQLLFFLLKLLFLAAIFVATL